MQYTHELYNKKTYHCTLAFITEEKEDTVTIMDENSVTVEFPKADNYMENKDYAVRKLRIYQEI